MSKKLNEWLGLPIDYRFSKSGEHVLPEWAFKPETDGEGKPYEELTTDADKPKYVPSDKLLVTCDIVENSIWNGKSLPILAVLDRVPDKDGKISYKMDPVNFFAINRSIIDSITISLLSDALENTTVSNRPTTAVLRFRSIK